ncbi:MAG: hypothetical protein H7X80_11455, partial [bacterium]|nr:hypothetical protein [Candidatus Kapabacteria bacterium]
MTTQASPHNRNSGSLMLRHILPVSLAVVLLASVASFAQETSWVRTNGPFGGKVTSLRAVDEVLFALAGSLFRSTNGGADWHAIGPAGIRTLALDSSGALLGLSYYQLFKSTDNGDTWRTIAREFYSGPAVLEVGTDNSIYRIDQGTLMRQAEDSVQAVRIGFGDFSQQVSTVAIAPDGRVFAVADRTRV